MKTWKKKTLFYQINPIKSFYYIENIKHIPKMLQKITSNHRIKKQQQQKDNHNPTFKHSKSYHHVYKYKYRSNDHHRHLIQVKWSPPLYRKYTFKPLEQLLPSLFFFVKFCFHKLLPFQNLRNHWAKVVNLYN